MIDATLACKDANSKLVEVVTVADIDAEDRVGNSLLIWELTFGQELNFCSDVEHKGWSRFRSRSVGKILKLEFVQHFTANVL